MIESVIDVNIILNHGLIEASTYILYWMINGIDMLFECTEANLTQIT
jgi:hypothetical protein